MENNNPFANNPFAPKPPATPESGIAEFVDPLAVVMQQQQQPDIVKPWAVEVEVSGVEPEPEPEPVVSTEPAVSGAKRFRADTPFVLGVLLFLIAAIALASFFISFSGLYAAAAWAVGENHLLQIAVPVALDLTIIAMTLSLFIERERGERVVGTWIAIGIFAVVSATANVLHTFVVSTSDTSWQLGVGALISGGAPILLAFATDKIGVRVFQKSQQPNSLSE